ncbi:DUF6602 domain-containing protein [Lacinutrix himadriensis]|uniref:DUF6602 domain-containing protein n=1 Tax=Lacinutrix himadriensis TaxID=641549 RepID=UPI0006E3D2EE|nr:DUF6602 domain-containing protein [Lacinutrix himadriensis]
MTPVLEVLLNNIKILIESADLGSSIGHEGLKGKVKEEHLSVFLLKYLPRKWNLGNGKIADGNGSLSAETDLIIYNEDSLPKAMLSSNVGVFPIESCRYAFEVKSTINATEIKSTIKKFNLLKKFDSKGQKRPIRVLFAYSSDLKKENEIERIKKYDSEFHTHPAIDVLLVVGKGYWSHTKRDYAFQESRQLATSSFYYESISRGNNFEIAMLLSAMLNTLSPELPHFSNYLNEFKDHNDLTVTQEVFINVEENSKKIPLNDKDKLIIRYQIFEHKNKFHWFKEPKKIDLLFNKKKQKLTEPVIEINIINDGEENVYIESVEVLTSRQLVFFFPIAELYGYTEFPLCIKPHEANKIGTKFICFPKRNDEKAGGKLHMEKGGTYFWEHRYEFKNTLLDTFGVIKIKTSSNRKFYSDEINFSQLIGNERYNHLDFMMENVGPITDEITGGQGMKMKKGAIRYNYQDDVRIIKGKE